MADSRTHVAPSEWVFDAGVTAVFDDMLARSIPQLETLRDLVAELAAAHVRPGTTVYDLGCSLGGALGSVRDQAGPGRGVAYVGYDTSEPMVAEAARRFTGCPDVKVSKADIRSAPLVGPASVVLAVLTLQFVPEADRLTILRRARAALVPGGVLVLVEKIVGTTPETNATMVGLYHAHKVRAGYSPEEVARKAESLRGVLVPWSEAGNVGALRLAGFTTVEPFWRWLNFAGWIATG